MAIRNVDDLKPHLKVIEMFPGAPGHPDVFLYEVPGALFAGDVQHEQMFLLAQAAYKRDGEVDLTVLLMRDQARRLIGALMAAISPQVVPSLAEEEDARYCPTCGHDLDEPHDA